MSLSIIETKVSLPALVVAVLSALGGASYVLATSYGFHPSAEQNTALTGLGAAVLYAVQVGVGYLAPHTSRDAGAAADVVLADSPDPAAPVVDIPAPPVTEAARTAVFTGAS